MTTPPTRCDVCGEPREANFCRTCAKSYDRYTFKDVTVMAAIVWAARRARRFEQRREAARRSAEALREVPPTAEPPERDARFATIHSVLDVAYHRNGGSGRSFYLVRFRYRPLGPAQPLRTMGAVVSVEDGDEDAMRQGASRLTAVFDVDALAAGRNGAVKGNAWHGNDFHADMERAIADHERAKRGAVGL